jgi:hypothetical protein
MHLLHQGKKQNSRNGAVLVAPEPVTTVYENPTQRVFFHPLRDANPFFHFMESLWMLAGRNDVRFVKYYAASMEQFSDNGDTLHGAYGHRWRQCESGDQLPSLIKELRANPESRRCVLQMWSASPPEEDLGWAMRGGKDVPCNTHCYFMVQDGALNMTVCCRSNDIFWGAYGANAVHFSMLLEYVARAASLPVGCMYQVSNNYHAYVDRPDVKRVMEARPRIHADDRYGYRVGRASDPSPNYAQTISPYPIMENGIEGQQRWDSDLTTFFSHWGELHALQIAFFHDPFFIHVVVPLANAHHAYKGGDIEAAKRILNSCHATDWKLAAQEWLQRREEKHALQT